MRTRREVLTNVAGIFVVSPIAGVILWWGFIAAVRWAM
jgi:hypothetical protein